jgi:hypothetical protein
MLKTVLEDKSEDVFELVSSQALKILAVNVRETPDRILGQCALKEYPSHISSTVFTCRKDLQRVFEDKMRLFSFDHRL